MSNQLDINEFNYYPSCGSCGSEYATQTDIGTLIYSRATASDDWYFCTDCKEETIQISNCCNEPIIEETTLCSKCKEHCK